jgi:hypothetical protein
MNGQAFKMNLDQFKNKLISKGYKEYQSDGTYTRLKNRNKMVTIQDLYNTHIYYDIERKTYRIEHVQFNVTDFAKALKNIEKFERKIGR